ncbi:MAG: hypothetical protein HC876_17120 [Chloroflexaceae bacterium]|nr:hypothetical protein [Chloroflexaceae bacterium]
MQPTSTLQSIIRPAGLRDVLVRRLAALRDWRPLVLVGIALVGLLLTTQAPFVYQFQAGKERGRLSDLPSLFNFNTPETGPDWNTWRWSRGQSAIVVPGVGQRSVVVSMDIVSHRAQWFEDAPPTVLYVQAGDLAPVPITLRQAGARYHIYVPAEGMRDGELWLELITEGWQNPVDSRENLGVALGNLVEVRGIAGSDGFVLPSGMLLLSWSGCLLLLYFMLRLIYFPRRLAFLTLLPLALLIPLLVLLNAPRLGFGNGWVWQFGALALLTAAICRIAVPPLLRRLEMVPPEAVLRWLLLLVVMSFAIKYGGRSISHRCRVMCSCTSTATPSR